MRRWILHADMDAFFAAVEQRLNPSLRGKPVIVGELSSQRGVVAAASYEARPYGIRAGMPIWEARQRCPHGVFLPGNMPAYAQFAFRALKIYQEFTPIIEPISIDEAFLDVTGSRRLFGDGVRIAREIKRRVREELGLTVSIGVAPNKLLAKMISDWDKPDGLTVLAPEEVPQAISHLPVEAIWGVGESLGARLRRMGVETIGDLAAVPVHILTREFGVIGRTLHLAALGQDDSPVEPYYKFTPVKSMGHEITFEEDVSEFSVLRRTLRWLAQKVGRRVRREGYQGRTVILKLRFDDFTTITRNHSLSEWTDLDEVIFREGLNLLARVPLNGRRVRLIGISLSNLVHGGPPVRQLTLLEASRNKLRRLMAALDRIRDRFGDDAVCWCSTMHMRRRPIEDNREQIQVTPGFGGKVLGQSLGGD